MNLYRLVIAPPITAQPAAHLLPNSIFSASTASTAAAGFSALLAAILLAVLGQLAVATVKNEHRYPMSLKLGLVEVVLLLTTTYMFVLLSGVQPTPSSFFTSATGANATAANAAGEATLRLTASLFIICGSALAVGAALTAFFLGLVLAEAGSSRSNRIRWVGHETLVTGVLIDAIFLAFGYKDIADTFDGAGAYPWWVVVSALLLVLPILITAFATWILRYDRTWLKMPRLVSFLKGTQEFTTKRVKRIRDAKIRRIVMRMPVAIGWFAGLPVIVFRVYFTHDFGSAGSASWLVIISTLASALWAGVSFASCILTSGHRVLPPRATP